MERDIPNSRIHMTEVFEMKTKNGEGLKLIRYQHDIVFPNNDHLDVMRGIKNVKEFKYQAGDMLFCSYPKCGINWIGNTLWKLKTTAATDRPKDDLLEFNSENIELQKAPRLMFTHLRPSRLPQEHIDNGGKIVLLFRNPKDVLVSLFYYLKNAALLSNQQTFDELFEYFIKGDVPFHSYFGYMKEWDAVLQDIEDGKTKMNVEVFYYEDWKKGHRGSLSRFDQFLSFNRDADYLDRVMRETTIEALAIQDNTLRKDKTSEFVRNAEGKTVIYRKGVVGDWKTHLTAEQSNTIDRLLNESTPNKKIKFQFE